MKTCVICGEGVGACEHTRAPTPSECLGIPVVVHPDMPADSVALVTTEEIDGWTKRLYAGLGVPLEWVNGPTHWSSSEAALRALGPRSFPSEYQQQFPETDPRDWCVCGHRVDAHTPRGRPHDIRGCRYCDRCTVFRDRTRS